MTGGLFGVGTQSQLVARVQAKVEEWVRSDYTRAPHAVSDTTRTLLDHWFSTPHRMADGSFFAWYPHQRRAVETVIYLHEACHVRRLADLTAVVGSEVGDQRDPWPKLGLWMATGSGKTKVMSLLAAWAFLNRKLEGDRLGLGSVGLVIAPNLIVLERLLTDFAPSEPNVPNIFRADPIIPRQFDRGWDVRIIHPQDVPGELVPGQDALILSNIQRLQVQADRAEEEVGPTEEEPGEQGDLFGSLFGPAVPKDLGVGATRLWDLVTLAGRLFVMNDEAHHVHDEQRHAEAEQRARAREDERELAWHRTLMKAHADSPLGLQLDFSGTLFEEPRGPRAKPVPFRHTVFYYSLPQARNNNVVKRAKLARIRVTAVDGRIDYVIPRIDASASDAWDKYTQLLQAGIAEWKKAQGELDERGLSRKAVLFVVCEDARKEAPEIARGFEEWAEEGGSRPFAGRVLEIHIGRKELENDEAWAKVKEDVKKVDALDNPYSVVVSVLMLREGWDVRNVKVIVPLRPCTSRTLTEQVLGRGLRKMFPPQRNEEGEVTMPPEDLIVIEHESFTAEVLGEVNDEGTIIEGADGGTEPPPEIRVNPVQPEEERARRDVVIPYLLGAFETREDWPDRIPRPLPALAKRLQYISDIPRLKGMTMREDIFDPMAEPEPGVTWMVREARYVAFDNVLGSQARRLLNDLRVARAYETEVKALLKECYRRCVFDLPAGVTLDFGAEYEDDPEGQRILILNIQRPDVREAAREMLDGLIRQARTGGEAEQVEVDVRHAKDLPGFDTRFPESRDLYYLNPEKCVFDRCCFDAPEERLFAECLDRADDVASWLYNDRRGVRFFMQYIFENKPAYYYPDFIVRLNDGSYWLAEPKGRVTAKDVAKARRGARYCEIVERHRPESWHYFLVVNDPGARRSDLAWWRNTMPLSFAKLAEYVGGREMPEVGLFGDGPLNQRDPQA
jgi:type III restriction enzyme